MTWAQGANAQVVIGFESSEGVTPGTPNGILVPILSSEVKMVQPTRTSKLITGSRNPSKPARGNRDVSGPNEVPLDARNIGYWLKTQFGAPETTDISTAGKLTGATGVTTTIGTWTAVNDGAFKVSINGGSATAISGIDFTSGVTTMANVASKIQAAIRAIGGGGFALATVAWDAANTCFVITSGTTGALSSVSNLTAPDSGTNIAGSSFMKCTSGTAVSGAALYQHVYKIGDSQPSLFYEHGFTDLGEYALFNGVKVNKASYAFGGDGDLTLKQEFMGMKQTLSSTSVDSTPSDADLDLFDNFMATLKEGGATVTNMLETSFDIGFNLQGNTYGIGGAGYRTTIGKSKLSITGKIKATFDNMDLFNKALAGTESSLQITLTNGLFILDFLLQELQYAVSTPPIPSNDGLYTELDFEAYHDNAATASAIIVSLTNDVASYA